MYGFSETNIGGAYAELFKIDCKDNEDGTLDVDYKERIINYMADNGLRDSKDMDWSKVSSQPDLAGIAVRSIL